MNGQIRVALVALALTATMAIAQAAHPPPFDSDVHPPAPDYADPAAWAAKPGAEGAAGLAPPNTALLVAGDRARADVFYVHPTTLRSHDHWNQRLDDAETNTWTDESVIARQASIFNACCRVFAPRYRQAGPDALYATDGSGQKAYDLAYQDVRRAFQYYLTHDNHGRPFILAGHSQGSLMIYRLIAEFIDGKPLQQRFIAAYTPGVGVSMGDFGQTYRSVQPCGHPDQVRCVATWEAYARSGDPSAFVTRSEGRYVAKHGEAGKALLCVNPLTFDLDRPAAEASANTGALPGAPGPGPLPGLIPDVAAAACEGGVLMVDPPTDPAFKLTVLPNKGLHFNDMDLFYENIRENAAVRVAAYFASVRRPGRR